MKKISIFIMKLNSGKNFLPRLCFSNSKNPPRNLRTKYIMQFMGWLFILLIISSSGFSQGFTSKGKLLYRDTISLGEHAAPNFADVDDDGDIDLFVGTDDYRIAIFTNDGSGNFEANGNFQYNDGIETVGNHPHPAFADLDGDNDLDLYLGYNGGAIIVTEQIGPGDFEEVGFLSVEGASFSVASNTTPYFVDLDRDADLDLAVGDANGVVHICYNDGGGVFTLHDTLEANGTYIDVGNNSSPAFGDTDGDGDIDIYVGNEDGKVEVFSNNGSNVFTSEGYFTVHDETVDVGSFAKPTFGNIDNDGVLELYIGNQDTTVYVFSNDGSGNFSANGVFRDIKGEIQSERSGQYSSPEFADIDGDSNLDLYLGNSDGHIALYINDGTNIFIWGGFLQVSGSDLWVGQKATPTFADLDGDDDLDLYVGTESGSIFVFTNNGTENFTAEGTFKSDGETLDAGSSCNPVFADLDNDNDLDLYVGEYYGHIYVYINDGSGNFTKTANMQAGESELDAGFNASPYFIDIDKDNDLDLYVSNNQGDILLFENDDDGTFLEADTLKAEGSIIAAGSDANIAFANLDGSCIPNLYAGNLSGYMNEYESFDITPPVITSEWTDFDTAMDDNCEASLGNYISSLQVTDNCDSELDMVQTPVSGTTLTYGDNPVKIVVTDDGGYSDSIIFNVIAYDATDPVIMSAHNDETIVAGASCYASVPDYRGEVTAEDNCDLELDITQSPVPGTSISGPSNSISLTATDDDGNSAEVSFNAVVKDETDPEITCVQDAYVTADETNNFTISGTVYDATAIDNCEYTITNDLNLSNSLDGETFGVGDHTITWTVTDKAGNTISCNTLIAVQANPTGYSEITKNGISIYPIPVIKTLNIMFNKPVFIHKIQIYDATGQQLYIQTDITGNDVAIDMNQYKSGLYMIQIKTSDDVFSRKIIKR